MDDPDLADAALRAWFASCPAAAVAFSGGVDSALVAWYARQVLGRARVTAWIADSPSLTRADLAEARAFAAAHDLALEVVATAELEDPRYAANPVDRCYWCKGVLYDTLRARAGGAWVCSGANADDRGDWRPGLRAGGERAVRSPLLECGLGKAVVRALARRHGLACADKPAAPCLSSRIPYGQAVTREKLARIEAGEAWLHRRGFPVCRVRHDGDTARVEVPADRLTDLHACAAELTPALCALGFAAVQIDAEGFVSGKLNRGMVP